MGAAAPLVSIPEAPVPDGAQAEWFQGAGGARLRAATFPTPGPVRGTVVLSPGRTEPIEKYFETITDLTGRGFQVLAHDWRGQGLSQRLLPDRLRGHAEGFQDFLADHEALLDAFGDRLPRPWIALGHSMGGCLVMLALAGGEHRFDAAIVSAPMLAVVTGRFPPWFARAVAGLHLWFGRGGEFALPSFDPLADRFEIERMTHDRRRYDRYKAQLRACPDLALGAVTWGWLDFALKASLVLGAPGALESIRIPLSLVTAGDDRLVLNAASKAAVRRAPQGRCLEIAGAFHEILMEIDPLRDQFWRAFDALVDPISGPRA